MSRSRPFHQLDVFTSEPLRGNPVAVVHEAEGLSDGTMQAMASWTNLSETTFLLPPTHADADYRVRIFTPRAEMPFAGHPTLGSCRAWLAQGGRPKRADRIVQECKAGLIELRRDGARLSFVAPPCRRSAIADDTLAMILGALSIAPENVQLAALLDNGARWATLLLRDAESVLQLEPHHTVLSALPFGVGVVGPYEPGAACQLELRAFAPSHGIPEDPVTGSLNAAVAQWLLDEQRVPEDYVAAQGARVGRAGRVHVAREGARVWIGGEVALCVQGALTL
jgi:PhzF family phenazine biosynthesis protein